MKITSLCISVLCSLAVSSALVSAQTPIVLDDFTGPTLDTNTWLEWGPAKTQSNSRLHINVPAITNSVNESGINTFDGFEGDFDFVVHFDNLVSTIRGGSCSWIELGVESAENLAVNSNWVSVEIWTCWDSVSGTTQGFDTWYVNGTQESHAPTKGLGPITAGQFRIQRVGNSITASARKSGQKAWTVLKVWPNHLSKYVSLQVGVICGEDKKPNTGKVSVDIDKITYVGKRIPGAISYGSRCHDFFAARNGFAFIGNSTYGILVDGGTQMANAPIVLMLGAQKYAISLAGAGAPGCYLNTLPILTLVSGLTGNDGFGLAPLPIPNDSSLIGVDVKTQVLAFKNVNKAGFALSDGVSVKILKP